MKRILTIGVILLFIGSISSSTGFNFEKDSTIPLLDGNTLYVGGSGPGNYTKIQDAIDDASEGDTVFVYNGTYEENQIRINKSISLIGESRENTIINSRIYFFSYSDLNDFVIRGFTTRQMYFNDMRTAIIKDNYILGNETDDDGITIYPFGENIVISDNIISDWGIGIYHYHEGGIPHYVTCKIINNTFSNNGNDGISTRGDGHIIEHNIFINNLYGLTLISNHCEISNNTFEDNFLGLYIIGEENFIHHNNFIKNTRDAFFHKPYFGPNNNIWDNNYWNGPREKPKPIFGNLGINFIPIVSIWVVIVSITFDLFPENFYDHIYYLLKHFLGFIPIFVNFDWHPAQEPYDIGG